MNININFNDRRKQVQKAWNKAKEIKNRDKYLYRKDKYNNIMYRPYLNNYEPEEGWFVDEDGDAITYKSIVAISKLEKKVKK